MNKFLKVSFFFVTIFLANFFFVTEVDAQSYYLQSTMASENLLQGESDVELITTFDATTTVPTGTVIEIQFSRNGIIWHDSSGTRWGSDNLSDGSNSFDLSGLGWDQAYFYYKVKLSTDNASTTPELLAIDVSYSSDPQDSPAPEYHETGTMISENLLGAESDVELITNFKADVTIPSDTAVSVQFSRNSVSWFDSTGVKWATEALSNGLNEIDLSSLEWSGSDFYYKLIYQTASSTQTASVNEVEVNYSTDPQDAPVSGYYGYGIFLSDNLVTKPMAGVSLEDFAYTLTNAPASTTEVWIQFSNDGETFYSATGTEWGWTDLPESDRLSRENAISLDTLEWTATAFYYKVRFQTDDTSVTPELLAVKPYYAGAIRVHTQGDDILPEGQVGHWSFDGQDMKWHETGAEVRDSSGNSNHGSLEGGMNTRSATHGVIGQALSFNGTTDYIEATVSATTTISLWYKTDSDWQHLVKNDGSYYVNGVSGTPTTFPLYIDGGTVHIGKDEGGSFVSGKIDEVRIYNRALSEAEIQKLYQQGGRSFVITPPPPPPPWTCGDSFTDDRDSEVYSTVLIGDQCWFAEDLRYECDNYYPTASTWTGTECADQGTGYDGLLYQWSAAMNGSETAGDRGLCPEYWHIPTDEEIKTLEGTVDSTSGVGDVEWDGTSWRGDDAGDNLKDEDENWYSGTPGWVTGWDALPGGYRNTLGSLYFVGSLGSWWSSSGGGGNAWYRFLHSGYSEVGRNSYSQADGFSVRCLRD